MASLRSDRRPPLVPLDTTPKIESTIHVSSRDDVSEFHHGAPFDFGGDDKFDLMHITVTLHGLTGIIAEKSATKRKKKLKRGFVRRPSFTPRKASNMTASAASAESSVVPSMASTDNSSSLASNTPCCVPTTAVVAFSRNVSNSTTKIYTHLPSIPLGFPSSSFGPASRYVANWPEAASPLLNLTEEESSTVASFTFLRVMKREPILPGHIVDHPTMSTYVHETVDMGINLARGKDLIALGTATLAISGDEEAAVMMNVPIKPFNSKRKKLGSSDSLSKRFLTKNGRKRTAFATEPSTKYRVDENATLRVSVQVLSWQAVKDIEERKKARVVHLRKMKEQVERTVMERFTAPCSPRFSSTSKQSTSPKFFRKGFFQMFTCVQSCDAPEDDDWKRTPALPFGATSLVDDISWDGSPGVAESGSFDSSVVSSVSGSESDSESDDGSRGERFLYKKIAIRKKIMSPDENP